MSAFRKDAGGASPQNARTPAPSRWNSSLLSLVSGTFSRDNKEAPAPCFAAPRILHPYSAPRLGWDMFMAILLLYTAFMVPFALAFESGMCQVNNIDIAALVVLWAVDVCFWIDIALQFNTALPARSSEVKGQTEEAFITDRKTIAKRYLSTWFILDVSGAFPVQLLEDLVGGGGECSLAALRAMRLNKFARLTRVVKLLRLLRMARFNRLVTKVKDVLQINPGHLRLIQFFIGVFFVSHFLACFLFAVQEWSGHDKTWAHRRDIISSQSGIIVLLCPPPIIGQDGKPAPESETRQVLVEMPTGANVLVTECLARDGTWRRQASQSVQYLVSLYALLQTITTVGYGDFTVTTTSEIVYGITTIILGASGFGVVVGSMSALLGRLDLRVAEFKDRMTDLEDFMHHENIPLELRLRVRDYCSYAFHNSREIPSAIEHLSMTLRCDVALHLYRDLVTSVPFFSNASKEFLTDIIMALSPLTLSPGDLLYEKGDFGDSMYFLIGGKVEVEIDAKKKLRQELSEGCYIGESSLMGFTSRRPLTVKSLTWCNLFCLEQAAFKEVICQHATECAQVFGSMDPKEEGGGSGKRIDLKTLGGGVRPSLEMGEQPPIVKKTLEMLHSERKDEMEEMERYLQGDATHNMRHGELGLGNADAPQSDADKFGSRKAHKRQVISIKEDELLQDPVSLKADYDLSRVQMNNDLSRLQSQLKSVFKA